jgi:predicted house-cleaning noncanonical NTP pyrophosphatase (MazG superfamily)
MAKEKVIIFDAGALISLSMNGLLYVLKNLKKNFDGHFLITDEVRKEIIDIPIQTKRYELEALRVKELYDEKILESPSIYGIDGKTLSNKSREVMEMTNSFFKSHKRQVKILHSGESSCIALSKMLRDKGIDNIIASDERTLRVMIEKPENLRDLLEKKLHTKIDIKASSFGYFKDFKIIRSAEILYVAWKKNLVELHDGKSVLDALLYAVKFKGCAISFEEIEEIKRIK